MTDKDISQLAAEGRAIEEEGAELMWRNILADIVVEMLASGGTVTRDNLEAVLQSRIRADETDRLTRAAMQGALKGLDGRMPSL